jgi:N-methylhydantoinase B
MDATTNEPQRDGEWQYFGREKVWRTVAGATFRYLSNGGGGWGSPFARDPGAVLRDVRNGYVSIEGARRDYGVVISGEPESDPEGLALDLAATAALRAVSGQARSR